MTLLKKKTNKSKSSPFLLRWLLSKNYKDIVNSNFIFDDYVSVVDTSLSILNLVLKKKKIKINISKLIFIIK